MDLATNQFSQHLSTLPVTVYGWHALSTMLNFFSQGARLPFPQLPFPISSSHFDYLALFDLPFTLLASLLALIGLRQYSFHFKEYCKKHNKDDLETKINNFCHRQLGYCKVREITLLTLGGSGVDL